MVFFTRFAAALCAAFLLSATPAAFAQGAHDSEHNSEKAPSLTPTAAMRRLIAGNNRFVSGNPEHTDQDVARRKEVAKGQTPFAMILSCSDSRVPPEVVFDQGLGDLFIVRNAGNGADLSALASMQYAGAHLGPRLLILLGHEKCGAISAAMAGEAATQDEPDELKQVLAIIRPGIAGVSNTLKEDAHLSAAVEANVRENVHRLMNSPGFHKLADAKSIQVIGAVYDLETGKVRFLTEK